MILPKGGELFMCPMNGEGMNSAGGNQLSLDELEQIENAAHRSHTAEAETVLRLSGALREALQAKENALALVAVFRSRAATDKRQTGKF
jgi:hypothetical protein